MAKEIDHRGKLKGYIAELEGAKFGRKSKFIWKYDEERTGVTFYTDGHSYHITATEGYLGCAASCRKPRPGEDWARGSDLAGGELNDDTWQRILRDIVTYELKTISDYILYPPTEVAEETQSSDIMLSDKD